MRVIICGDTHIGAIFGLGSANGTGGNTRVDDYEKTLNYIIDYAIETKADAFIQTGDAFESRTPSPEDMNVINQAILKLSMANITSVIIMGNHDYRRTGDVFTSAISSLAVRYYPNTRIVLEPQVLSLGGKDKEGADIVLLPYRDRRMYEGKNVIEDSALYDSQVRELLDSCSGDKPIIAIGHNFFYEGSYEDYGGNEILTNINTYKKCDLVAMGHYHNFRVLRKKNPIAIYTGSMEKLNFGDADIDKFFIDYDTEKHKVKVLKCPSRELYDGFTDLSMYDFDDFKRYLEREINELDLQDKIVRLKVAIKDKIRGSVKKGEIEKMLYNQGAFYVSRVNIEPVFTRIVKDNTILKQKDDASRFKAYVESQDFDELTKSKILSEAEQIMIEINRAEEK